MDRSTVAYAHAQPQAHGHGYPRPQHPQYQHHHPQAWGSNYAYAQGWNHYRGYQGYGGMPMGHAAIHRQRWERRQQMIVHVGEGTTVAGQSTESFAGEPEVKLCYQCCKNIPLQTLMKTRNTSCNENTCKRTRDADIDFIPMPAKAVSSCEAFQIFLRWWMEKIDLDAHEMIEERARARVLEVRDDIPDAAPPRRQSK